MKLYYTEFWDANQKNGYVAGGISWEPFMRIPKALYSDNRMTLLRLLNKLGVLHAGE